MRRLLAFLLVVLPTVALAISPTKLVTDARTQIGKTTSYDPAYTQLAYPMGDVPIHKGVCTDVVIRALRVQNIDLQELIHKDMKANFKAYPNKWGLQTVT